MAVELMEVLAGPDSLPNAASSGGKELLEQHFHWIVQKLSRLSWFSGLPEDEAEEFRSWALLKLVENDYRILASWQGRSSITTFLTVVLVNLMRDYRTHLWGKWRPSAAARRQGPVAVLLERLWSRDNLTLDEAIERMRNEHAVTLSRPELERMAASLRRIPERRRVSEEELLQVAADGEVESRITDEERSHIEERLQELLAPLLRSLPAQDRLIIKLHYWDGLSIAAIAHLLGHPQKKLYTVRNRCLRKLRRQLEKGGLEPAQVREISGHSRLELAPDSL